MKNKILIIIFACMAFAALGYSEESKSPVQTTKEPAPSLHPRLMDESFVIETSETDLDESLNRLSGIGDRGYASEDYTYHSENHGKAGPFGRQDTFDNAETHGY